MVQVGAYDSRVAFTTSACASYLAKHFSGGTCSGEDGINIVDHESDLHDGDLLVINPVSAALATKHGFRRLNRLKV